MFLPVQLQQEAYQAENLLYARFHGNAGPHRPVRGAEEMIALITYVKAYSRTAQAVRRRMRLRVESSFFRAPPAKDAAAGIDISFFHFSQTFRRSLQCARRTNVVYFCIASAFCVSLRAGQRQPATDRRCKQTEPPHTSKSSPQ